MGGCWERLVRSVKTTLALCLPKQHLPDDETLRSMLLEAENIINTRPLTYIPMEHENDEALTPNHFLLGTSNGMKPIGVLSDDGKLLRKNYLRCQQFSNMFWRRWLIEYLPQLTKRTKWYSPAKPLQEGDVVIIVDENNPRNCWPKGRILKAKTSSDGQVRKAIVQTSSGIYERPAVKLAKLDVGVNNLGTSLHADDIPKGSVENPASEM